MFADTNATSSNSPSGMTTGTILLGYLGRRRTASLLRQVSAMHWLASLGSYASFITKCICLLFDSGAIQTCKLCRLMMSAYNWLLFGLVTAHEYVETWLVRTHRMNAAMQQRASCASMMRASIRLGTRAAATPAGAAPAPAAAAALLLPLLLPLLALVLLLVLLGP